MSQLPRGEIRWANYCPKHMLGSFISSASGREQNDLPLTYLRLYRVCGLVRCSFFGCGYCLLTPARNPEACFCLGRLFAGNGVGGDGGIKLELRIPEDAYQRGQHIYIR